jgi:hypothetical protein
MRESKKDSEERKTRLSILAPILKDLGLARKRIRKLGTARWLFDFAYSDLDSLSAGEITNFGFDCLALVLSKDPKAMDDQDLLLASVTAIWFAAPRKDAEGLLEEMNVELKDLQTKIVELEDLRTKIAQGGEVKTMPTLGPAHSTPMKFARLELLKQPPPAGWTEWLYGFHNELKKNFERFFTGHYWKHLEPATVKFLLCPGVRPYDDTLKLDSFDLDRNPHPLLRPVEQLMLIAGRAVIAEKEKFGVCERCKKPFIAEKNPLRKFCSDTCAQYVRTTRYRRKQRQGVAEGLERKN